MFVVDEPTAEAIRRAFDEGGELSGIVEFRRHFPLISDHAKARECVRIIAGRTPLPTGERQPKLEALARAGLPSGGEAAGPALAAARRVPPQSGRLSSPDGA